MILYLSLDQYEKTNDFTAIVEMAMSKINSAHIIEFLPKDKQCKTNFIIRDTRRCFDWFREFRENDTFINPSRKLKSSKPSLPRLFNDNSDILKMMLKFCRKNISSLTVDLVHDLYSQKHSHIYLKLLIKNLIT